MSSNNDKTNYRLGSLERKVNGLQRQVDVLHARIDLTDQKTERRLRDLEIRDAARRLPQKIVADIYRLSPGRISQIVKSVK